MSALVSDKKIEQEHFSDELAALESLEDEAESATVEVESYFTSLYMPDEDTDEEVDEDSENGEEKEVKLKEGEKEAFLKSLGDEYLKKYKDLKKEKSRLNRELAKRTAELQEKVNAIREELTAEQCEILVMQLLHEGFVFELDKYLNAEVTKTAKAVCGLWDKYHTSTTDLLAERKIAEDKLNSFLERLGYLK